MVEIVIVNVDKSETKYSSIDLMPEGALKEELKKITRRNPSLDKIVKILR